MRNLSLQSYDPLYPQYISLHVFQTTQDLCPFFFILLEIIGKDLCLTFFLYEEKCFQKKYYITDYFLSSQSLVPSICQMVVTSKLIFFCLRSNEGLDNP